MASYKEDAYFFIFDLVQTISYWYPLFAQAMSLFRVDVSLEKYVTTVNKNTNQIIMLLILKVEQPLREFYFFLMLVVHLWVVEQI